MFGIRLISIWILILGELVLLRLVDDRLGVQDQSPSNDSRQRRGPYLVFASRGGQVGVGNCIVEVAPIDYVAQRRAQVAVKWLDRPAMKQLHAALRCASLGWERRRHQRQNRPETRIVSTPTLPGESLWTNSSADGPIANAALRRLCASLGSGSMCLGLHAY